MIVDELLIIPSRIYLTLHNVINIAGMIISQSDFMHGYSTSQ